MSSDEEMVGSSGSESEEQIRVSFVTKHDEYRVTETSIAVPGGLGRLGLSKVVNHLLDTKKPVPFDFLVVEKDVLVRASLEQQLSELGVSTETVVKLEYAPAVQEPELNAESEWPDWISCVDGRRSVSGRDVVVSGCYDGTVQVSSLVNQKSLVLADTIQAHRYAVKSVCQFSDKYFVTASKDGTAKLYQLDIKTPSSSTKKLKVDVTEKTVLKGHAGSVESVDAIEVGSHAIVASGGWDHAVCIWKTSLDNGNETDGDGEQVGQKTKMRKTGENGVKHGSSQELEPATVFSEHTDNVSGVCWAKENSATLYTGSWDHSIRVWDVPTEKCTIHLPGNKVVTGISYSERKQLIASGSADHVIRLWDVRTTGDSIVKMQLRSHKGWVSSVKWCPSNENILVSSSHDHTIKIWDIRSNIPLHTLAPHTNKVLTVDWNCEGNMLFSGGADSMLRAHHLPVL
uniref:Ribosome biogenesis protein WDR12 homolog n=1 Tax=Mucochytrium quahogii TaxID=96639 RepID=A0A7S2RRD9_9STRA|mmetsp:Transcript_5161/g.7866  ORF Transcript_5161/g.7866 Transcript_5161/m.7866 type:complete len:457 (+) Transcript_5161:54-1424(+)